MTPPPRRLCVLGAPSFVVPQQIWTFRHCAVKNTTCHLTENKEIKMEIKPPLCLLWRVCLSSALVGHTWGVFGGQATFSKGLLLKIFLFPCKTNYSLLLHRDQIQKSISTDIFPIKWQAGLGLDDWGQKTTSSPENLCLDEKQHDFFFFFFGDIISLLLRHDETFPLKVCAAIKSEQKEKSECDIPQSGKPTCMKHFTAKEAD